MFKTISKFAAISALAAAMTACVPVPAGYVGVQVNKYGGDKGVDIAVKQPGRHWEEWNVETFLFPTYTQTKVWDNNPPVDESFQFQSEGMTIRTNVGVTYHIKAENAPVVFQKYRKGIDEVTDVFLRAMIRDTLSTVGATYKADEVHSEKRSQLEQEVQAKVIEQAAKSGITVERVYFVGGMILPDKVIDAINAKVQATQTAQAKENELRSTIADAQKAIEAAKGEAEATRIRGEALRANPQALEQMKIEKWDGKNPSTVVINGNGSLPSTIMLK